MMPLGEALRLAREARALSQAEVARRAHMQSGEVCRIEAGKRVDPAFSTIADLGAAIGIPLDELREVGGALDAATTTPPRVATVRPELPAAEDALTGLREDLETMQRELADLNDRFAAAMELSRVGFRCRPMQTRSCGTRVGSEHHERTRSKRFASAEPFTASTPDAWGVAAKRGRL